MNQNPETTGNKESTWLRNTVLTRWKIDQDRLDTYCEIKNMLSDIYFYLFFKKVALHKIRNKTRFFYFNEEDIRYFLFHTSAKNEF